MSLDIYVTCQCCGATEDINLTHNLRRMAAEAGIGDLLWRDEPCKASDLAEPVAAALADLRVRPDHYRQFNAPNGWGTYEWFLQGIERLHEACSRNGDAEVEFSR